MSAERLVDVCFAKDQQLGTLRESVGVVCRAAASYADCMYLLDILCYRHQRRHWSERLAKEICVETCDDHSDAAVCQCLYDLDDGLVKELSLVDTYNLYVLGNLQHLCR